MSYERWVGRSDNGICTEREREKGRENESLFLNVSRPSALFRPRSIDPGRKGWIGVGDVVGIRPRGMYNVVEESLLLSCVVVWWLKEVG
jgi:hypothetical protein